MHWNFRQLIVDVVRYPSRQYSKFKEYRHRRIKDESLSRQIAQKAHGDVPLPRGFLWCLSLVATVLLICLIFTIWAGATHSTQPGLVIALHEGKCSTAREANFWVHLLINALATVTFAASSYTMQRLAAPTRQDLDNAHKDGDSFRIGSLAIWNFTLLSRTKGLIVALLWASSFPLHLVFNSAVVYTATNAEWSKYAIQASESQLSSLRSNTTVQSLNITRDALGLQGPIFDVYLGSDGQVAAAQVIMQQLPQMTELSPMECIQTYRSGSNATWGDVVVVTEVDDGYISSPLTQPQDSSFPGIRYDDPWNWMCSYSDTCDADSIMANGRWVINDIVISKCFARPLPEVCELNTSLAIMLIVIICLSCKLFCMVMAVLLSKDRPLLTIGDAIASYIENRNTIPFKRGKYSAGPPVPKPIDVAPKPIGWVPAYKSRRHIAMVEMPGSFWRTTILGSVGLIIGSVFFNYTYRQTADAYSDSSTHWNFQTMLDLGFDLPLLWNRDIFEGLMTYSDADSPRTSYISGAILTNLPQIGLSAFYLTSNHFYTCFFRGVEFQSYSTHRRGLRVSRPKRGTAQRQAHYLQLPLRYSIPKIMVFILLHTLLSQTLFLRRTYATYPTSYTDRTAIGKKLVSLVGYSPLGALCFAVLLAVVVLGTTIVAAIPIDWIWKGTDGNSRVIADSCAYPPRARVTDLGLDAETKPKANAIVSSSTSTDAHLSDVDGDVDTDAIVLKQVRTATDKQHDAENEAQYHEIRWGVVRKYIDGRINCAFSIAPVRRPDIGEKISRILLPGEKMGERKVEEKGKPGLGNTPPEIRVQSDERQPDHEAREGLLQ
jgi:hypothetical protein